MFWTPNTKDDLDKLHSWYGDSLDGIVSDVPTLVKEWVDEKAASGNLLAKVSSEKSSIDSESLVVFVVWVI